VDLAEWQGRKFARKFMSYSYIEGKSCMVSVQTAELHAVADVAQRRRRRAALCVYVLA
jgi:hypothetical protein